MTTIQDSGLAESLPRTARVLSDGIESGLHRGGQVYVSFRGEPVVNAGVGEAAAGQPMTRTTLNLWRSSGKPMTAAALLRVFEERGLDVTDLVQSHLPEFAPPDVRIVDLLAHNSGLPNEQLGWPAASWNEIVAKACQLRRDPSVKAAYSYSATWFLLGEVLRRLVGADQSYAEIMRSSVFEPLGMHDTWNGMSADVWAENQHRIAEQDTVMPGGRRRAERLHQQASCVAASPGSNLRSTARDVGRFYEALHGGEYFRKPTTLAKMTTAHREGVTDATFKADVRVGLGVILASPDPNVPYGFGDHASGQTYGHGGAQCAMAFCDPLSELVVAWVVNGFPGEPKHQARNRAINTAIYEDLVGRRSEN